MCVDIYIEIDDRIKMVHFLLCIFITIKAKYYNKYIKSDFKTMFKTKKTKLLQCTLVFLPWEKDLK